MFPRSDSKIPTEHCLHEELRFYSEIDGHLQRKEVHFVKKIIFFYLKMPYEMYYRYTVHTINILKSHDNVHALNIDDNSFFT